MDELTQAFVPPSRIDLARETDFQVGALSVRPSRCEVESGGVRRSLQRRVMQVLVALAHSTNQVVSQHELILRCWGGLSVSDDAIGRCIGQLRRLVETWPEPPYTIQTIAGVGYRLAAKGAETPARFLPELRTALPSPSLMPIVAVLPFSNLSDDPGQDYFAAGVVEELVVSLSRFRLIHVVSAGAGVISGGKRLAPTTAARELGARYLLDGSIRRAAERLRIIVHLIDGRSATQNRAGRFDGAVSDVFELQDRVAEHVAGAIEPVVQEDGVAAASRRPTSSLDSYDLYLRALPLFRASRKAEMHEAIDFLERAVTLDPKFGMALGLSSICHRQVVDHDWSGDVEFFRRRGLERAERALIAAPDDARAIAQAGAGFAGLERSMDRALALTNRAIALNPASPLVWLISGSVRARAGQLDVAGEHLENAIRLDPISTMGSMARMYLALCRFQQRRFEEARALFGSTSLRLPVCYATEAALYGHLGEDVAARTALATFESLAAGSVEKFARLWFPHENHRTLFLEGVQRAEAAEGG